MLYLIQWFGEQTEAVKLALIGLFSAFFAGGWAAVKEWRKPVLSSNQTVHTSANAPASADDPDVLLLAAVEAINYNLVELLTVTKKNAETAEHLRELNRTVQELRQEIYITREILQGRSKGGLGL